MNLRCFSTLIKPASSLCNMRCGYCFYADVSEHRQVPSYGIMSRETSHRLIDRIFEGDRKPDQVSFAFQGGEPTLAGIDYFEDFVQYAKERAGKTKISCAIQTNGYALDEAWCRLFRAHDFLVGVSLDADERTHDRHRLDMNRQGTHRGIMKNIGLMQAWGVPYNVLSVVTGEMARHPQRVFRFYLRNKFQFVQLIPCLDPLADAKSGGGELTARGYASFLKQFFDLWYEQLEKGNYISVRQFDNIIGLLAGRPAEQCGMVGTCSPQFVIEADGSVYPCDFYVLDRYRMGGVWENSLEEMTRSGGLNRFLSEQIPIGAQCAPCPFMRICGGGCKRYRPFYHQTDDYCPWRDFLEAAYSRMAYVAGSLVP